jgi:Protein of unknown function (DUF3180)
MRPTRARVLLALALLGAVVGWALTRLVDIFADRTLPVPWTAPFVMGVLAIALALWARGTNARLRRRPGTRPMDPLVAARSAALAMAASRTGALVAGFYLGVAVALLPDWDISTTRTRIVVSGVGVATGVLVVLAALWLERVCRVPPDPSEESKP